MFLIEIFGFKFVVSSQTIESSTTKKEEEIMVSLIQLFTFFLDRESKGKGKKFKNFI